VERTSGAAKLRYHANVELLGKATPIELVFYCDPHSDANSKGALGFDLFVEGAKALAPFAFDDFEGPDAPAARKPLLRAIVHRSGKIPLTFQSPASGWYDTADRFAFGVSAPSGALKSTPRSLLAALSSAGAERLTVEITDFRRPDVKLAFDVPVADRTAAFKALVAALPGSPQRSGSSIR
jgi:hypothetical protein